MEKTVQRNWSYGRILTFFFLYQYTDLTVKVIANMFNITVSQAYNKMYTLRHNPAYMSLRMDAKDMARITATRVRLKS